MCCGLILEKNRVKTDRQHEEEYLFNYVIVFYISEDFY